MSLALSLALVSLFVNRLAFAALASVLPRACSLVRTSARTHIALEHTTERCTHGCGGLLIGLFANFDDDWEDDWASITPSTLWYAKPKLSPRPWAAVSRIRPCHNQSCQSLFEMCVVCVCVGQVGGENPKLGFQEPRVSAGLG